MTIETRRILLQWATIFATFLLLIIHGLDHRHLENYQRFHSREMQESSRNERSTPRSFVLPASPEIALQQERRRVQASSPHLTALKCLAHLMQRGYWLGGEPSVNDAQTIEALYEFQLNQGIAGTGRLDEATMRYLQCS